MERKKIIKSASTLNACALMILFILIIVQGVLSECKDGKCESPKNSTLCLKECPKNQYSKNNICKNDDVNQSQCSSLETKFYQYTLADNFCDVNLTLLNYKGKLSISAYKTENSYQEGPDTEIILEDGQTKLIQLTNLTNGTYKIKITGSAYYRIKKIFYCREDKTPPEITIFSPVEKKYPSNLIEFNFSTNEGAKWCNYSLNNLDNCENISNISYSKKITAHEGSNELSITCSDISGNIGSKQVNFYVDSTAPGPIKGIKVSAVKGENILIVSWEKGVEPDIAQYNIYRSNRSFKNVLGIARLSEIKLSQDKLSSDNIFSNKTFPDNETFETISDKLFIYKDTWLSSKDILYYAVTAVDEVSNERKNVVAVKGKVADAVPPPRTSWARVSNIKGEITLKLEWNKSNADDISHYNVYRSMDNFSIAGLDEFIGSSVITEFYDSSLLEGKKYYYAITGVDVWDNENLSVKNFFGISGDITPPIIEVEEVGEKVAERAVFSATLSDDGVGLLSCQVCIGKDKLCKWKDAMLGFSIADSYGACYIEWNTTGLELGKYFYNFRVTDLNNNTGEGSWQKTELILQKNISELKIKLEKGWNLISFHLLLKDQSISTVFRNIAGLKKVYYFDRASNRWRIFNPRRNFADQPNSLLNIERGKSYWVEMNKEDNLVIYGTEEKSFQADLLKGWNYIGWPYGTNLTNISTALRSIDGKYLRILSYDPLLQKYESYSPQDQVPNNITAFEPGKGYLIEMVSGAKWVP